MEHDWHPEPLRLGPEPVVRGVVQRPSADRVGPEINALEAERRDGAPQLVDRRADIEQGHHADANQAPAVGGKIFLIEPVVVGAADRGVQVGVARVDGVEAERRKGHGDVDPFLVHRSEARLR
jgi:hypothetical protein